MGGPFRLTTRVVRRCNRVLRGTLLVAALGLTLTGCAGAERDRALRSVDLDALPAGQAFLLVRRIPACGMSLEPLNYGPLIVIWPDGRVVRATDPEHIRDGCEAGMLRPHDRWAVETLLRHGGIFAAESVYPGHLEQDVWYLRVGREVLELHTVCGRPTYRNQECLRDYLLSVPLEDVAPAEPYTFVRSEWKSESAAADD